jgi:hypothetical protein
MTTDYLKPLASQKVILLSPKTPIALKVLEGGCSPRNGGFA